MGPRAKTKRCGFEELDGFSLALVYMALDDSYLHRRQENARIVETAQRDIASKLLAVHVTKRAPVPFEPYEEAPTVTSPVPRDGHLERTADLKRKEPRSSDPSGRICDPWAQQQSGPDSPLPRATPFVAASEARPASIFGESTIRAQTTVPAVTRVAPEVGPKERAELLTQHNEWTIQKNDFMPDVAAAMRVDVRKSAWLAAHIHEMREDPNLGLQSSVNVRAALGDGVPPHLNADRQRWITPQMAHPRCDAL